MFQQRAMKAEAQAVVRLEPQPLFIFQLCVVDLLLLLMDRIGLLCCTLQFESGAWFSHTL